MSREFQNMVAVLLLTLAGFIVIRQIITSDAVALDWPLPLVLTLAGLALALFPERSATGLSPVPAANGMSRMPQPVGDDLTLIKGIGPQRARTLAQAGCANFSDLARVSESELAHMLADVGAVAPTSAALRSWIKQAQIAGGGNMAWLREYQASLTPHGEESA